MHPRCPRPFVIIHPIVADYENVRWMQSRLAANLGKKLGSRLAPADFRADDKMRYIPKLRQSCRDGTQSMIVIGCNSQDETSSGQFRQNARGVRIDVPR